MAELQEKSWQARRKRMARGLHSKRGKHNRTTQRTKFVENKLKPLLEQQYKALMESAEPSGDVAMENAVQDNENIAEEEIGRSRPSQKEAKKMVQKAIHQKKTSRLQKKRLADKKKGKK
ncbi:hypothetical protein J8273_1091 [Carpediemonas membranifera]|uniref:Uncharacterized protein n=1 Tax=Carpediemonas membranifera TaxID=201153 RepID=A0A8J6BGS9_9EUKA|nr:hypothetical protein J8273_1091 [Carpediemonas membranifera]|eukprot:KAG9397182.1 hypothetical protein J8273_1091 [Carpediemonas membranifera]